MTYEKIGFIAPSTCLSVKEKPALNRTARLLKKALGSRLSTSAPIFTRATPRSTTSTAPVEARAAVFKEAIRELDLIISVAGGTGAEDLVRKIDAKDLRIIRDRRPLFIGFSDFTFLLNEIYHACRVPVIYFPSLKVGKGDFSSLLALINGEEIHYDGAAWLTPPRRGSCPGSRSAGTSRPSSTSSTAARRPSSAGSATSSSSRTSRSTSRTSIACSQPYAVTTSSPGSRGSSSARSRRPERARPPRRRSAGSSDSSRPISPTSSATAAARAFPCPS